MITYRKGNLLDHYQEYDIIAHGVNCQGVMASGFAKGLREKFPWAYESYKEACDQRDPDNNLGRVRMSADLSSKETVRVAHCFTQLHYGRENFRYVSYDAIDDCMNGLDNILLSDASILKRPIKVAMPMIGAGLGGGSWKVIEAIINDQLWNQQITVFQL